MKLSTVTALLTDDGVQELSREEQAEARLTALFSRAMAGELGNTRARKAWERQKLSPKHLRMIQMRAAGCKVGEIAEAFSTSIGAVSNILNQEDSKILLAMIVGHSSNDVLDIRTRLRAVAGEALETVVDVMRSTRNDKIRVDSAFKLLDRAGYGAVERKEIAVVPRIDSDRADKLLDALNEAMELDDGEVEANYTVLATDHDGEQVVAAEGSDVLDESVEGETRVA